MKRTVIRGRMAGPEERPAIFDPWLELRAAIVRQAAIDFIHIMQKLWRTNIPLEEKRQLMREKIELEEFFYSSWYDLMCEVPPEKLIRACLERARKGEQVDDEDKLF